MDAMKCDFCDRVDAKLLACHHRACPEYTRRVSKDSEWCIACYEAAKSDYESEMAERHER